jgi:hypothetical protein
MSEDFMFIDEEVYDAQSRDLIHTIASLQLVTDLPSNGCSMLGDIKYTA